ncbi:hypothetical protein VNO78_27758 [Psophocarpus tetragonolobus]|uniref:Uncharacterized protein n=1 Tax=Psophocarpus tetragonolobus TaxID=3891 RepID=A0AAN9S0U8_PSOTE
MIAYDIYSMLNSYYYLVANILCLISLVMCPHCICRSLSLLLAIKDNVIEELIKRIKGANLGRSLTKETKKSLSERLEHLISQAKGEGHGSSTYGIASKGYINSTSLKHISDDLHM